MANEVRLIDANALLERLASNTMETWAKSIERIRAWWPHAVGIKDNIVSLIKEAPTVDAVEVVRCRNCKHSEPCGESRQCLHPFGLNACDGNDFCSYGERREGE